MPKILVCEDEELTRKVLVSLLTSQGHEVVSAPDGVRGLELIEEDGIELVISDIQMKPMGGVKLLEAIRANGNNIPFIMITAHPDIETFIHAIHNLGAFEYIQKPLDLQIVSSIIEKLLGAPPV